MTPMQVPPTSVAFVKPTLDRAAEIQAIEPIVALYCKLYAVQQVLETKLHLKDAAVAEFATALLNDIEEAKSDSPELTTESARDIIGNEDAAHAYVINFAYNVFERTDRAVREFRATRATAAGLIAAAGFLDLERIWGPLTQESAERIKYAKYQAARILKAIKAGQDPNDQFRQEAEQSAIDHALEEGEGENLDADDQNLNPEPARDLESDIEREADAPEFPSAPSPPPGVPEPSLDDQSQQIKAPSSPQLFGSSPPKVPSPPPKTWSSPQNTPDLPTKAPASRAPDSRPSAYDLPTKAPAPSKPASESHYTQSRREDYDVHQIVNESKAMSEAKRHANYAVSALSFEDSTTAMSELTLALGILKRLDRS